MSILFGKRKAKSQIGEFHGKLKSNDISDYERLSKDLAIMLADKNVVLLNAFNDEKCQQKNELINNCFQYVSEGNGAHQLLLLGSKAIEAWDEWNRNNNDGNRNYTVLSYPHPSRTSGYNKMWNQVDYKKIKTRNYSSLKDIQQFKLN